MAGESRPQDDRLKGLAARLAEWEAPTAPPRLNAQLEAMHGVMQEISKEVVQVKMVVIDLQVENKRLQALIDKQTADFAAQLENLKTELLQKNASEVPVSVTPDLNIALTNLENKTQSYVVTSRAAQMEVIREQDREKDMQAVRKKNLRVAGLEESDDENTLKVVTNFLKETLRVASPVVESTKRLGKPSDRGPRPVLIRFRTEEEKAVVLGNRGLLKGKKIWLNPDLTPAQEVTRRQELVKVKEAVANGWLGSGTHPAFLVISYFAPSGAPIYSQFDDRRNPFDTLAELVAELETTGAVWVLGDFNARTNNMQTAVVNDFPNWRSGENEQEWTRTAVDSGSNSFTDAFIQFGTACGLTIVNGSKRFPDIQGFTFSSETGCSTVDYLLASKLARERICSFAIGQLYPESDHRGNGKGGAS
ncbi:hypothetical protein R1sor_010481 [Riccia sorocarpa]|uniref:Endonuclease/exonuclease/phosphatase domain-containing protein n=1 Tax=Riccia sorocarpa TaxID=122646 RepID=A0ABD3HY54_9MARC